MAARTVAGTPAEHSAVLHLLVDEPSWLEASLQAAVEQPEAAGIAVDDTVVAAIVDAVVGIVDEVAVGTVVAAEDGIVAAVETAVVVDIVVVAGTADTVVDIVAAGRGWHRANA